MMKYEKILKFQWNYFGLTDATEHSVQLIWREMEQDLGGLYPVAAPED
jgi:hypothetical protein